MELSSTRVDVVRSLWLPAEEARIMPLGDIQWQSGGKGVDVDRLKRHIAWGVDMGAYWLGMGDPIDFASPSNRRQLKQGQLYDTVNDALDQHAAEATAELLDILRPTAGRWLGLLAGHHWWRFQSGETSDQRLAAALDAPFLGDCAMVEVRFKMRGHLADAKFTIWAHHGVGGGRTLAHPLNTLEHVLKAFDADVYLMGHHHKKVAGKLQRISAEFGKDGDGRLSHRNLILACTGSFMKGYEAGRTSEGRPGGSYVEQKMLNPVALGGLVLWARPRVQHGRVSVDLDISV